MCMQQPLCRRDSLLRKIYVFIVVAALGSFAERTSAQLYGPPTFDDSFDTADLSGWIASSGQWQVSSGHLVSTGNGAADLITVDTYDPFALPDIGAFGLDVHMSLQSSAAASRAGIAFGYNAPNTYCEFSLSATGVAQIRNVANGAVTVIATKQIAAPGAGRWMHVNVEKTANRLSVSIDGAPVFRYVQTACDSGDVGLVTRNGAARFDDFHVRDTLLISPYIRDFDSPQDAGLPAATGTWAVSSGALTSTAVGQSDIAIIPLIERTRLPEKPGPWLYTVKARALNGYGARGNILGIVFGYINPNNYYEAVFTPTGIARVNRVSNGIITTLGSAPYQGGGPNTWFEIELIYRGNQGGPPLNQVRVNGHLVLENLGIEADNGHVGLVTHWTRARFDWIKAEANVFQPVTEDFSSGAITSPFFSPSSAWSVESGVLESRGVTQTEFMGLQRWRDITDTAFSARVRNLYTASGNIVGLVYGWRATDDYYEVVFSPAGTASLRRVLKGQIRTLAQAPFTVAAKQSFDVHITQRNLRTTVRVNGATLFNGVYQPDATQGYVGLVAHWTRASFDNVKLEELAF